MAEIFKGKEFAQRKLIGLAKDVKRLNSKGIKPKLVSVVVGNIEGGKFYQRLKQKKGRSIGCEVEIIEFDEDVRSSNLIQCTKKLNEDESVHGIMIQLPLPEKFSPKQRDRLIGTIAKEKDVDAMRNDSTFVAPAVRAVLATLKVAESSVGLPTKPEQCLVAVVGAKGFVGKKIVKELKKMKYQVAKLDIDTRELKDKIKKADVVISATGKPNLIKSKTVKKGAVLIDVGAPKGDIERNAYKRAIFVSPVPGGVGPITIAFLLENLVQAAGK